MALEQWQLDLMRAVNDKTMADIRSDARAHAVINANRDLTTAKTNTEPERGTGWVEAKSIDSWKPPGVEYCDRMMDEADMIDKAQRVRLLTEAAALLKPPRETPEVKDQEKEQSRK
jgi:hypothetical protein